MKERGTTAGGRVGDPERLRLNLKLTVFGLALFLLSNPKKNVLHDCAM